MTTRIRVDLGTKMNLGNFSNMEVHVFIEDDVRQDETAQKAIDRIFALAEKNIVKKAKEYEKDLKSDDS